VAAGELVNIDVDLIGCKEYIKVQAEYSAAGAAATVTSDYALALGDYDRIPPEA